MTMKIIFYLKAKILKKNDSKDDSSYNKAEREQIINEEKNVNKEDNNMDNIQNIEIDYSKENEEDIIENGEKEYKIEGEEEVEENNEREMGEKEGEENNEQEMGEEEEGEENYEKEMGIEEHLDDEDIQNDLNSDKQNEILYNIEEYIPYQHKHDQYSCSCCEHYYNEAIENNSNLPKAKCEVCGNEINQSSLNFYKNKNRNSKTKR